MDVSALKTHNKSCLTCHHVTGFLMVTSCFIPDYIFQIVTMMREYLDRSGQGQVTLELNDLCNQLELTATNDEIDLVGGLLSKFADLQIQKIHQNS